jgi:haloalkane dehalogenase
MTAPRLPAPPLPDFIERQLPSSFARYAVTVDGWRFHVMEAGDPAARPVLFLHGNPTWSFLWRKVAARLSSRPLRLIMPDLLGLGFSDKPGAMHLHTLNNHGRWMAGLLDALEVENVILTAQDWGGPVGLLALSQNPSRMTGPVLSNTVASPPRADFRPTRFHRFARLPVVSSVAFRLLDFPQRVLHTAQGDRGSIQGDVARAYRFPLAQLASNQAPLALARMVPDSQEHPSVAGLRTCQQFVESFHGPAALVWGDRDPILGRTRSWMEKLLPQATVTRTSAGHFLQEEVPDAIADAVLRVAGLNP